jgi:(2Fe-2S) ferredoxin
LAPLNVTCLSVRMFARGSSAAFLYCRTARASLLRSFSSLQKPQALGGKVRINKAGCLDQCEHGPTVVVYPEAVWYGHVQPEDAEEIVRSTWWRQAGGAAAAGDECVNTKSCPHRELKDGGFQGQFPPGRSGLPGCTACGGMWYLEVSVHDLFPRIHRISGASHGQAPGRRQNDPHRPASPWSKSASLPA